MKLYRRKLYRVKRYHSKRDAASSNIASPTRRGNNYTAARESVVRAASAVGRAMEKPTQQPRPIVTKSKCTGTCAKYRKNHLKTQLRVQKINGYITQERRKLTVTDIEYYDSLQELSMKEMLDLFDLEIS